MSKKGYRTGKFEKTHIILSLRGVAFSGFELPIMFTLCEESNILLFI